VHFYGHADYSKSWVPRDGTCVLHRGGMYQSWVDHFVHMHIFHEEPNYTISMLYEGGSKITQLPNPALALYSCHQLTLQLARMGNARHSYSGPPHNRQCPHIEAAQQDTTTPQDPPQMPQWDTGYGSGYSEYQEGSRGAVVPTTLTVLLGLAMEKGPPALHGTPIGITPLEVY
jgi:hypothetical protein